MARGWKFGRAGAAIVAASVAAMVAVLPASAEPVTGTVVKGGGEEGLRVTVNGEKKVAHLFGLKLSDGGTIQAYCINIKTSVDYDHPDMVEVPWDAYPDKESPFNKNRAKINWLLRNSYPFVELDVLKEKLNLNGLSKAEAIAATQAAAWHFSDDQDLDKQHPTPDNPGSASDVLAVYDYLTGEKNVGLQNAPAPALEISPKTLAGEAGKRIGPFTVSTTGSITELTSSVPEGVKVVGKDGTVLTAAAIKNGTEVFLDVPASAAAGQGSFDLKAKGKVDTGRVFVAKDKEHPTQNLIVAQSEETNAAAKATASWTLAHPTTPSTPAPQGKNGELAATGASIAVPIGLGLALLAAGVGALLFLRRRSRA